MENKLKKTSLKRTKFMKNELKKSNFKKIKFKEKKYHAYLKKRFKYLQSYFAKKYNLVLNLN